MLGGRVLCSCEKALLVFRGLWRRRKDEEEEEEDEEGEMEREGEGKWSRDES
jgi:hypothetical protein